MTTQAPEAPSPADPAGDGVAPPDRRRLRAIVVPAVLTAAGLLVTLLGLLTLLFFLVRLSGDPAAVLAGPSATPSQLAAIRADLGLDEPLYAQYLSFLGDVARLDFGSSIFSGESALAMVIDKLPATVLLTVTTLVVAVAVGVPGGVFLAQGGRAGRVLVGGGVTLAQAVPGYIVGVLLIYVAAVKLGWFPAFGSGTPAQLVLPTLTLAAFSAARTARMVAAELEQGAGQDYLRTALAKGASPRRVLWRHALPNAFPPVASMLVVEVSYLISGAVVIEVLFAYNGVGKQLVDAIYGRDYPIVQATVFVIGVLVIVVNVLGDLILRRLDPRTTREAA